MGKKNFRGSFRRYNNQHQSNIFQYHGPYPQHEIQNARELLIYQFHNHSGNAIRRLRQKMYNSVNFFHQQQIDSVVSSSFSAFQECSTSSENGDDIITVSSDEIITVSSDENTTSDVNHGEIDIFNVENHEKESKDTENITVVTSTSITVTSQSDSSIEPPEKKQRLSNETPIEPPEKKQHLSNETTNSQSLVTIDANGNFWNESTSSTASSQYITNNAINGNLINHSSTDATYISSEEEEGEISDSDDEPTEDIELCLMCDLCLHVVRGGTHNSKTEMEKHFVDKKHNAASLVHAVVNGDKLIPISVEEKHCMSNNSFDSSILPICPECNQIHGNVWTCALHYQQYHNVDESNVYGLGKVVDSGVCQVSSQHCCSVCQQTFPFAAKLHKHWKSQKHFPFKEPHSNQIMLFTCGDCGRRDQSFLMSRGHILSAHSYHKHKEIQETNLNYIYLEKTDKLTLLPQKSMSVDQQIEENQAVFKKAARTSTCSNWTKNKKRKFKKSVLGSKKAMMEYKNGEDYDPDRKRYNKFLKRNLHYDVFHFSQKT